MSDYLHILGDFLDGLTQLPYSDKRTSQDLAVNLCALGNTWFHFLSRELGSFGP